tara:strand:+ start:243 stop:506 length:264 start_codon:yes stop_codon:yes gene_type:complete
MTGWNEVAHKIWGEGGATDQISESFQRNSALYDILEGDYSNQSSDYDWDWDFQPGNNQWVCRGVQSGQYAELSNCSNDLMLDDRWPS